MRRVLARVLLACTVGLGVPGLASAGDEPRIRAVTPAFGMRGSTVDVAIEGQHLHPFQELKCHRTDLSMTNLPGPTATKVSVRLTIPETAAPGPVKITIKTKDGTVATEKFTVRARTPTVTRVQPDTVTRGGEHELVLTGTNLSFPGRESQVAVDPPMSAKVVGKPTDKSLTVRLVVPADVPAGGRSLVLTTTDGKFSAAFTVTLAPPSVTSVRPAEVGRGTTTEVAIAGRFLAAAGRVVLAVPDDAIEVANASAPTADALALRVTVKREARPGPRLLVLSTPDGVAAVPLLVTSPAPRIVRLQPAGVARGGTTEVDLGLEDAPGAGRLRLLPEDPAVSVAWEPPGKPRITVAPDAIPGPRTLLLEHPFGLATTTFVVNLKGPTVTGLEPAEVAPGTETEVLVQGQDLAGARASLAAADPGVTLEPGAREGTWKVRVAPDARPGPRPLFVRTEEGAAVAVLSVTGAAAAPPSLAATGARAPRGAATEVELAGLHLRAAGDRPPEVSVAAPGPAIPAEIVASSPGALRVRVSPPADATLGGAALVVRTPEGVAAAAFLVVPARPAIAAVEPASLVRPGPGALVVTGSHLSPAGAAPQVLFQRADGSGALPVAVEASEPGRLALRLDMGSAVPAGPYLLVVRTPEGGAAWVVPVEAAAPVVEALRPDVVGVPANAVVTLSGRHLVEPGGAPPQVTVTRLGGASNLRPQVLAATPDSVRLRLVTLPGTPAAPHVLVLRTADGVASAIFQVTGTPQPTVAGLEPKEGARGASVVATIRGTGLLAAEEIRFAGEGVRGTLLPGGTDGEVRLRIVVAADAATGPRAFSLVGAGGTADGDPLTFTVR